MKPWAVIRYRRDEVTGFHFVNRTRTREEYVYGQITQVNALQDFIRNPPDIVWCGDERAADTVCEKFAEQIPNSCWVKVQSSSVHSNTIVKSSVTKSVFSEAGLLPA